MVLHLHWKQARFFEVFVAENFFLLSMAELYHLALLVVRGGDDVSLVVVYGMELTLPIVATCRLHNFVVTYRQLLFQGWQLFRVQTKVPYHQPL